VPKKSVPPEALIRKEDVAKKALPAIEPLTRKKAIALIKNLLEKQTRPDFLAKQKAEFIKNGNAENCILLEVNDPLPARYLVHLDVLVGDGTDGKVYMAQLRDDVSGELFIVKIRPNEIRFIKRGAKTPEEKFESECRIVSALKLNKGKLLSKDEFYLFLSYGGITIQELPKPLPEDLKQEIALKFLIEANNILGENILHLDLKPRNVVLKFIAKEIKISIIDYGESCFMGDAHKRSVGTCELWPPEALPKDRPAWGINSESYAIGMMLFIILSEYNCEACDFNKRDRLLEHYNAFIELDDNIQYFDYVPVIIVFKQFIKWLCCDDKDRRPLRENIKEMIDKIAPAVNEKNILIRIRDKDSSSGKKKKWPNVPDLVLESLGIKSTPPESPSSAKSKLSQSSARASSQSPTRSKSSPKEVKKRSSSCPKPHEITKSDS
jgi:serine/threonine protein kinase